MPKRPVKPNPTGSANMANWVCAGGDRFEYPAGQTPTRCPVAGCADPDPSKLRREQKLRG